GPENSLAAKLCADAMRNVVLIADEVGALPGDTRQSTPVEAHDGVKEFAANGASIEQAMGQLESCAKSLRELQPGYRKVTLSSLARGTVSADEAFARVDAVRRLERLARHASLSAAHLVDSRAEAAAVRSMADGSPPQL